MLPVNFPCFLPHGHHLVVIQRYKILLSKINKSACISDKQTSYIFCPKLYFPQKGMLVSWSLFDLLKVNFIFNAWSIKPFHNTIEIS